MTGKPKHGGSRPGAGRKPKAVPPPTLDELDAVRLLLAGSSVEDLMELAVRYAAYRGRWDEVSKSGARLIAARAKVASKAPGPPDAPKAPSRFAPRPPPPKPN